ncbi:hypothetical protein [Phocaeicola plebeius]|uniref:hypothetical protein n=1 Tax=Phocaeicola plebeius TaxID=310297 RepID=UPI0026EBB125|nr:hypothetical protein [Phocaeicola plebeius]
MKEMNEIFFTLITRIYNLSRKYSCGLFLLALAFVSCKDNSKEYAYPQNTFLENVAYECPLTDLEPLHYNYNSFNINSFASFQKNKKGYFITESMAHVNENDTTAYEDRCKYIINLMDCFILIDDGIKDYLIKFDSITSNITSITIDKNRIIESVFESEKLVRLNSYNDNKKQYLNGYCVFNYLEDKISDECWYDIKETEPILNRKVLYEYDGDNRLIKKLVYNSNNKLVRELKYSYTTNKQVINDTFYDSIKNISTKYTYDAFFNLLSKNINNSELNDSLEYRKQGDIILKVERKYKSGKPFDDYINITRLYTQSIDF